MLANTGSLVLSRVVIAALGWAGTLLIIRHLSVERWGRFSFVFAFLGLLSIITDLGIGRIVIGGIAGEHAVDDPAAFAGTYIVLRALLGIIGYVIALAFVVGLHYPAEVVRTTAVAGLVVVIATPSQAFDAIFQAHLRMPVVAVAGVVGQASQLALTVAVVVAGGSLVRFAIPAVVAEVVIASWKIIGVRRVVRPRFGIVLHWWKQMLVEALPLAVGGALGTIYYRVDSVMLSKLDSFSSVGIYNVAYKFADVLHFLPLALLAPLLTLLVRAWPGRPDRFRHTFHRGFTVLVLGGGLAVTEFCIFARPIISTLYGSKYAVGAGAARLVVGTEGLHAFTLLAFTALVASGRHRIYPLVTLVGVFVNVGLNLVLIPHLSYLGAAWATVATEVVVLTALWGAAARIPGLHPLPWRRVAGGMVAAVLAAATAFGVWVVAPWPLAALAAAAVFALVATRAGAAGPGGFRALASDDDPPPAAAVPA
jgi:O-antigen/teichoic acid export membrane protein